MTPEYQRDWHKKNPGKAAEYQRTFRRKNPEFAAADNRRKYETWKDYLLGLKGLYGCKDCNNWFPSDVLEFDHVPSRGKKVKAISQFTVKNKAALEELVKCDIVCPTCHKNRTLMRLA